MADNPVTREEKYLAYLTGDYKGEIPKPITRKEKYLYELCLKGIGGEISPEEIKAAVNEYLEKNPVKPGATTEQAQQIEQNKTDIGSLKTETDSLKDDLSNKITKFYASSQGETHITDSDNGKIQDMMLYGKSEQNQYKGINLLPTGISYGEIIEVSIPKGTRIFWVTDGTPAIGGNFKFYNEDKTQEMWFGVDAGKITTTETMDIDAKYMEFLIDGTQLVKICLGIGDDPIYEPYTGGQPSPSPDYPQEIKSVVNPTVKVTNEDGLKVQSVTINNVTLNAIPVSSGGNVTINGQQYVADYVDVERGKLVRMVDTVHPKSADDMSIYTGIKENVTNYRTHVESADKKGILSNMLLLNRDIWVEDVCGTDIIEYDSVDFSLSYEKLGINSSTNAEQREIAVKTWLENNDLMFMYTRRTSNEIDLTPEEVQTFKALATYYPVTNISVNSEQLDGYTVFNYPISLANGWNYVKQQLNDNRDYIYDMDLQSAESYVNSEYAVALTELEV